MSFTTNNYRIDFLDVNDADSILIKCYNGTVPYIVLIDAGNINDYQVIKDKLNDDYGSLYIDLAICTHPDKDHIGGFFGLLDDRDITINEFWLIDPADYLDVNDLQRYRNRDRAINAVRQLFDKPNDTNDNLISKIISKGINWESVIAGAEHDIIPVKVVAPTSGHYKELVKEMVRDFGLKTYEESDTSPYDENALPSENEAKSVIDIDDDTSPYNASSLVILFQPGNGNKYLFTGDANCASLKTMIDSHNGELEDIKILKVPHHGSKHNMTTEIIESLRPEISVVSAKGTRKHPNSGIVYWLSKHGPVYSTHKSGSLRYPKRPEESSAVPLKGK